MPDRFTVSHTPDTHHSLRALFWKQDCPQQLHKHPPRGHGHCVTHHKPTHTTHTELLYTSQLWPDYQQVTATVWHPSHTPTCPGSPKWPHRSRHSHTQDPRRSSSHAPRHAPGIAEPLHQTFPLEPACGHDKCWLCPMLCPPACCSWLPGCWQAWGRANARSALLLALLLPCCPATWVQRVA